MENIVEKVEGYLKKYVTFSEDYFSFPAALWIIGTHCFREFDVFPYLTITASTKQAGKSTLKNIMIPVCKNGGNFSAGSPSSMFRLLEVEEGKDIDFPSMFIEEAEQLTAENHPAREFLNKGYEKGDKITRWIGDKKDFECYCPKVFILIGDVFDTLKDRSIPIIMRRRSPIESAKAVRVRMSVKKEEAELLEHEIKIAVQEHMEEIRAHYAQFESLDFLGERDELLFQSLFTLAHVFCPERVEEFKRIAVDVAMEKQIKRTSIGAQWEAAEKQADDDEARILLLRDMLTLAEGKEFLIAADVVDMLKGIPTAQWRKYKGKGLTSQDIGYLFGSMNLDSKVVRTKGTSGTSGEKKTTFRAYRTKDLKAAAVLCGLIQEDAE